MRNVILIGFMGTGKSSTGKMLSQRLGCAFIDMDNKIEPYNIDNIVEKIENLWKECENG